jgi:hypothetical protein
MRRTLCRAVVASLAYALGVVIVSILPQRPRICGLALPHLKFHCISSCFDQKFLRPSGTSFANARSARPGRYRGVPAGTPGRPWKRECFKMSPVLPEQGRKEVDSRPAPKERSIAPSARPPTRTAVSAAAPCDTDRFSCRERTFRASDFTALSRSVRARLTGLGTFPVSASTQFAQEVLPPTPPQRTVDVSALRASRRGTGVHAPLARRYVCDSREASFSFVFRLTTENPEPRRSQAIPHRRGASLPLRRFVRTRVLLGKCLILALRPFHCRMRDWGEARSLRACCCCTGARRERSQRQSRSHVRAWPKRAASVIGCLPIGGGPLYQ